MIIKLWNASERNGKLKITLKEKLEKWKKFTNKRYINNQYFQGMSVENSKLMVKTLTKNKTAFVDVMMVEELGIKGFNK